MRALPRLLMAGLLVLGLAGCGDDKQPQAEQKVQKLDTLVLHTLDGAPDPLTAYRGKVVLINIWATWCGPCRREMAGLQKLADRLDPNRFAVIGLSIDKNPALVREYLRSKNLTFARHIDPAQAVVWDRLGIDAVPTTLVLGRGGELRSVEVGEREWGADNIVQWLQGLS
jgi:thiol-disulfide isomerase/thioredoxin